MKTLKLRLCGHFNKRTARERKIGQYAKKIATDLIGTDTRIKTVQVTFQKCRANWDRGFSWLVKGDRVEILIPRNFRSPKLARWLVRHELFHARQILSGRLNKNLELIKFTDRRGQTRSYRIIAGPNGYGQFKCVETGYVYADNDEPWEEEVREDNRTYIQLGLIND